MNIEISFCPFDDGSWEFYITNSDTGERATLYGKEPLTYGEKRMLLDVAPPCIHTKYESFKA